jgi:hypothetical protein
MTPASAAARALLSLAGDLSGQIQGKIVTKFHRTISRNGNRSRVISLPDKDTRSPPWCVPVCLCGCGTDAWALMGRCKWGGKGP